MGIRAQRFAGPLGGQERCPGCPLSISSHHSRLHSTAALWPHPWSPLPWPRSRGERHSSARSPISESERDGDLSYPAFPFLEDRGARWGAEAACHQRHMLRTPGWAPRCPCTWHLWKEGVPRTHRPLRVWERHSHPLYRWETETRRGGTLPRSHGSWKGKPGFRAGPGLRSSRVSQSTHPFVRHQLSTVPQEPVGNTVPSPGALLSPRPWDGSDRRLRKPSGPRRCTLKPEVHRGSASHSPHSPVPVFAHEVFLAQGHTHFP